MERPQIIFFRMKNMSIRIKAQRTSDTQLVPEFCITKQEIEPCAE